MSDFFHKFQFDVLQQWLLQHQLTEWAERLPEQVSTGLSLERYGDLPGWLAALDKIPVLKGSGYRAADGVYHQGIAPETQVRQRIRAALEELIPWRKGPYHLFDIHIDTEWRSDWKWQRIESALDHLEGRNILDVGCGNGYHMWHMLAGGANTVVGVDPSPRFIVQFQMIKRLLGNQQPIHLVPCPFESLPQPIGFFDTVFSMGVLYHRRSPIDHLIELRQTLRPGGQLLLETLVIEGSEQQCLIPQGRYAKMRNVWFIPSSAMLLNMLARAGFKNALLIDETPTRVQEQRSTNWMRFESLPDFLMPGDLSKTIEGYSAPLRAAITAYAP